VLAMACLLKAAFFSEKKKQKTFDGCGLDDPFPPRRT
jgi:hypothetical protein